MSFQVVNVNVSELHVHSSWNRVWSSQMNQSQPLMCRFVRKSPNLLQRLQEEKGLTYLFVAHDLSVVHFISDRIAVIYHGDIVKWLGDRGIV